MQIIRGDHSKWLIFQKEYSKHYQESICKNDYSGKTVWIQSACRRDDQHLHTIYQVCSWTILYSLAFISNWRRPYSPREVQKVALRIILDSQYTDYKSALILTNLDTLRCRRKYLCLKFAQKCVKKGSLNELFPLNKKMSIQGPMRSFLWLKLKLKD